MQQQLAFCGLNCGECPVYIATQTGDQALKARLAAEYSVPACRFEPADMQCAGCHAAQGANPKMCGACPVRSCGLQKGLAHCGQCPDYPCAPLEGCAPHGTPRRALLEQLRSGTLHTPRLRLVALTPWQLPLWWQDLPRLQAQLGCTYGAQPLEGPFLQIVQGQARTAQQDPAHFLWHTFWWIVRRQDGMAVGSIDFKAPPGPQGLVEIGYGLGPRHQGHGYMAEAAAALCAWGLAQPGVAAITAETERGNLASQAVLKRCGFALAASGPTLWWRLAPAQSKE